MSKHLKEYNMLLCW